MEGSESIVGSVDNRVVQMKFDNRQFESGVKTSLSTLDKLKAGLNLDSAAQSISRLQSVGRSFSLAGMSASVDLVADRFSTLGIIGMTAIQNLTNAAVDAGKRIASSLINPIVEGGKRRALNIEQAKFQLEGLGVAWEDIKDDINYGVKDTAYGLDSAAKAASQLTASGVQLGDQMKSALRGISGVAAMTNSEYDDIARIFTTVAGNGRLMGDQLMQLGSRGLNAAATLATALGVTEQKVREMTSKGEIDFQTFADAMDSAYGEHAKDANKTFTGALSNMNAALSRLGADVATPAYEDLRQVLNALIPVIDGIHTSLSPLIETLTKAMKATSKFAVEILEGYDEKKLKKLGNVFVNLDTTLNNFAKRISGILKPIKEALTEVFPPITVDNIENMSESLSKLSEKFKISFKTADKLKHTFKGVFSVLDLVKGIFSAAARVLLPFTKKIGDLSDGFISFTANLGDHISEVNEAVGKNDSLYKALKKIVEYISEDFAKLLPVMSEFYESASNLFEPLISVLSEARKSVYDFVSKGLSGIDDSKLETFNTIREIVKDLAESFINVGTAILRVAKPITEAFAEVFPPITVKNIEKITGAISNFTSKLIIGEKTSDKLKGTFKGVFAVVDIVKQVFSALIRTLFPTTESVGKLGDKILSVTAFFGEHIAKIAETARENDTFYKALQNLIGFIKDGFGKAKEKIQDFIDLFEKVTGIDLRIPTLQDFADLIDKIKERVSPLSEVFGNAKESIIDFFKSFSKDKSDDADKKSGAVEKIGGVFKKVATVLGEVSPKIENGLSNIAEAFSSTFGKIDFGRLYKLVNLGFLAVLITAVNKTRSVISTIFSFGRVFHNLNGILVSVRGVLTAYTNDIKANMLIKIATAIAILAASLIALSMVKEENLTNALGAMFSLFVELFSAMLIMQKLMAGDTAKGVFKISGSMILVSVAISILAGVVKKLGKLNTEELVKGLISVTVLIAGLIAFLKFSNLDSMGISKGAGLMILAASINVLACAVKSFAVMDTLSLIQGLLGVAAVLGELALFVRLTGNAKSVISTAIGLTIIAASMNIFSKAIQSMSKMSWEEMARGLLTMAMALAAVTIAVRFMPANLPTIGVGLIAVAAINILSDALGSMGNMSWEEIGKGLAMLAGSLFIVTVAVNFMKTALPGALAMLVLSGALTILCPVLLALGKMSLAEIGKSLLVLAGAFVVIGAASALLSPITPAILAFAGAMVVFGLAFLAVGAGVAALAVGVAVLASTSSLLVSFVSAVIYSADILLNAITVLIMSILTSLETIMPKLIETCLKIVVSVLFGIASNIEYIIEAAEIIILGLLQGLASHMDEITIAGLMIIVKFINGIATMLPDIIEAGINLMVQFIDGMADGIREHTDDILSAVQNLMSAIIEFILSALQELVRNIPMIGNELVDGLEAAKKSVRETLVPEEMCIMGYNAADATAKGIKSANGEVESAGNDLGKSAKNGLSSVLGGFGSLGTDFGSDFSSSLSGTNGLASSAGSDVGKSATDGLSSTMLDFSSLGENFGMDFSSYLGDTSGTANKTGMNIGMSATDGLSSSLLDFGSLGTDFGSDFALSLSDTDCMASNAAENLGSSAMDGLNLDFGDFGESAGEQYSFGLQNTTDDAENSAKEITSATNRKLTNADSQYKKSGSSSGSNYVKGLSKEKDNAKNAGSTLSSSGVSAINSNLGKFRDAGVNSGRGFIDGINSTLAEVANASANLALTSLKSVRSALDIKSPSRKFGEVGMHSDKGLAGGLLKFAKIVGTASKSVGETAIMSLQSSMSRVSDVINGDIDINPTIRPVIDLSNVMDGANRINGLFGRQNLNIGNISGQFVGNNLNALADIVSTLHKNNNPGNSDIVNALYELRADVNSLGDAMSRMQIKMDSGALVGSIVAPMDMALGQRTTRKGRGN